MMKGLLLLLLVAPVAFAGEGQGIVTYRNWSSTDGKQLEALLQAVGPTSYKLKRKSDGRVFEIPIDRISADDQRLVSIAAEEVESAKKRCVEGSSYSPWFVGLPDPSEKFWQMAAVLGRAREVWEVIATSQHFRVDSARRVVTIHVNNCRREDSGAFVLEGDHIRVRLSAAAPYKLADAGDGLVIFDGSSRKTILKEGAIFAPAVKKDSMILCQEEGVGTGRYLVIALRVDWESF